MKNLFLSLVVLAAIFAFNTASNATVQDDPNTMKDCSSCEMKSDCNENCSGDMSGCSMEMTEFKKEPMKKSSGESSITEDKCPVSGDAIGDSKVSYIYLGKEYKFCCAGCVDEFRSEPMDYVKEDINCPVEGGAGKKDLSVMHDGTKYYFCCAGCDKEFVSNPEKYLNGNSSEE